MSFFKNKMKDERITQTQNKIYRELYYLVLIICAGSIAIKAYYFGFDSSHFATELVILFSQGVYYLYRLTKLGVYSDQVELHDQSNKTRMSTKNIIVGICLGVIMAVFFGIRSAILYADGGLQMMYYFLLVFAVSFMIYVPFLLAFFGLTHYQANKQSKKAADRKLDNPEKPGR